MNARDYIALLKAHTFLICFCVAMCLGLAAVATTLMPTSYSSSVTFYVSSTAATEDGASDPYLAAQLPAERVKSYAELLRGPRVATDAAAALGGGATVEEVMDSVSGETVTDTVLLTLTATGPTPERAHAIAVAVSDTFTDLVRRLETPSIGAAPSGQDTSPEDADGESAGPSPAVTAEVLQPADLAQSPEGPSRFLNLTIGLIVGLLLGLAAAVTRHTLDTRLRSGRQLAEASGAPVLGAVPRDRKVVAHPVALTAEVADGGRPNPRVEAYRRIRTALQAAHPGGGGRVLVVVSARHGEGRTSTACNLAASLAAVGARVALVDGDLRDPRVTDCLGLDVGDTPGLTEVLSGSTPLAKAVVRWEPEGIDVISSGSPTARSNELLASQRAQDVLADLRARYDYVIVDSPPLLSVADAASLATHADGVVLVARWRRTRRPDVEAAVAYLRSVSAPVLGAVLTRVPLRRITPADLAAGAGGATALATPRPAADWDAAGGPENGNRATDSDQMSEIFPLPNPARSGRRGGSSPRKRQPRRVS